MASIFIRISPILRAGLTGARAGAKTGGRAAVGAAVGGAVVQVVGDGVAAVVGEAGAVVGGAAVIGLFILPIIYKILVAKKLTFSGFGVSLAIKGSVIIMVDKSFDESGFKSTLLSELSSVLGKNGVGGYTVTDLTLTVLNESPLEILKLTCATTGQEEGARDQREAEIIVAAFNSIGKDTKIDLRKCRARVISMITSYNLLQANYNVSDLQVSYDDYKKSEPLQRKRSLEMMRYSKIVSLYEGVERTDLNIWN